MIRKMFLAVGDCPFNPGTAVGSVGCRNCKDYNGEPAYCSFVLCSNEMPIPEKGQKRPVQAKTISKRQITHGKQKRPANRKKGKNNL